MSGFTVHKVGVYKPSPANTNTTRGEWPIHISSVERTHPDAAAQVLGDFYHTNFFDEFPSYSPNCKIYAKTYFTLRYIRFWTTDAVNKLQCCFLCNDWDTFNAAVSNFVSTPRCYKTNKNKTSFKSNTTTTTWLSITEFYRTKSPILKHYSDNQLPNNFNLLYERVELYGP